LLKEAEAAAVGAAATHARWSEFDKDNVRDTITSDVPQCPEHKGLVGHDLGDLAQNLLTDVLSGVPA
jgi:hypothetical protein